MFLSKMELKNFRNYHLLHLDLSPEVNILVGANAQGKTNLLEAISLFCLGKSFRTRKESDLIRWGSDFFYIKGIFSGREHSDEIEIGLGKDQKKIKVNGTETKGFTFFGQVPLVIFSPEDLQLIKGGPQFRRDFIDLYLAQIAPQYRYVYLNYLKVLQQRNRLLKGNVKSVELDVWNTQLVEKGIKIIQYRTSLIQRIKPYIRDAHQQISGDRERLNLDYLCMHKYPNPEPDESNLRKILTTELINLKQSELERRITLVGPQRDDLLLTVNEGVALRDFGSQGQQRTAALALKLGLIKVIKAVRESTPLLLLDDVMSEFDNQRRQSLLKMLINSCQTFITATTGADFPGLTKKAALFRVKDGEVNHVDQLL
ncbi:MAG TPA: DNA replication/repair protein RecF [Bacillota bacterium]